MLQTVDVESQSLDNYKPFIAEEKVDEVRRLAGDLRGARILHLNATPYGGGVSELLRAEIPLLRDLGLHADWKVMFGDDKFFNVTKAFHNALQGANSSLDHELKEIYLTYNTRNARLLQQQYDYIIVHDLQPLALLPLKGRDHSKWLWRCHIDTSEPNQEVWDFLKPFVEEYDAAVFTMDRFVPPDLKVAKISIIPPAIDPLSPKNTDISADLCCRTLERVGVDVRKPLLTQVSRFDPWKDPLGVIDVHRMVKEDVPNLQLALVGYMALDDPEAWHLYSKIVEYAKKDNDAYVFTNLQGVSNREVNAFQRLSPVVIQKSIREGFGLVVSETLWKGTPVVAGRTGGISLQLEDGVSGYLCESTADYARKISYLFHNEEEARAMGGQGKKKVREEFLIPRLVTHELRLLCSL
jgi:trehalose synthase